MSVYTSGLLLRPPHGTNGHAGALLALDPSVWRCQHCYTVVVATDAFRAFVAAGWCTGRLAALPPAPADAVDLDDLFVPLDDLEDELAVPDVVVAVAHAVRSVFDVSAVASADPIARSAICGGRMIGWSYDACSARGPLTVTGDDGWTHAWPRKRVAAAVARACADPDIADALDRWRALSLELSRLADKWSWKDPERAREIEHERTALRRDVEARYSAAAALDLLGGTTIAAPAGQLSLFEAAS